jgi:hypothetical protein
MKKTILVFGGISSLVLGLFILFISLFHTGNAIWGYSSMILAFSFIYAGVRNYRDKYNDGLVSFGKAFRIGLGITLMASTAYVLIWCIDFYCFIPDFMEKYAASLTKQAHESGLTGVALQKKLAGINQMNDLYKNPVMVVLFTYAEVLPVGIAISLLTALILRRKTPKPAVQPVVNH